LKWSCIKQLPHYFLLLRRDKAGRVLDKYKSKLRTHLILLDDYSEAKQLLEDLQQISPRAKR
jgi:hypothetical protein